MIALTPEQAAAVRRSGQDVCVIAGPGSGKTRVLTERFSWLVIEQGVSPRNILALTFTEKAASEIKERVAKTLRERLPGRESEIELAPVSTFHGLCARILQEFSIAAGLDPATELWDERLAEAELFASVEQVLNDAARNETGALRKLFTSWNSHEMAADLCGIYHRVLSLSTEFPKAGIAVDGPQIIRDALEDAKAVLAVPAVKPGAVAFRAAFVEWLERLRQLPADIGWEHVALFAKMPGRKSLTKELGDAARGFYDSVGHVPAALVSALTGPEQSYLIGLLGRIADVYAARKAAAARMDFHDLEHTTIRLLRTRPEIRAELQRRFEHILMDEMQDTNPIQWTLIGMLRTPGTFFAVGDVNQSIYGFRFAAPDEFQAYRQEVERLGGEIDLLGQNFRSRAEILQFTEMVSQGLDGITPPRLKAGRNFRTGNLPVSLHGFEKQTDEFRWLADEILRLKDSFVVEPKDGGPLRALRLRDVAVLVRTTSKAEAVAAELAEREIAYTLGGGRRFFETQEVVDLLNYLEVLANPQNTIALAAVLRSPFVGRSDDQLLEGIAAPTSLLRQRARMDLVSPDLLLVEALDASGYCATLGSAGQANVDKFLRLVREEWQRGAKNMRAFVQEMQALRAAAGEKSAPVADAGDAVQILTVHASKGLEFPVVFVAGAYFHSPNSRASLSFHPRYEVGVRWLNPMDGRSVADYPAKKIEELGKEEDQRELQRMLYVALTRAEQKLYVSWGGTQKRGWLKHLDAYRDVRFVEGLAGVAEAEESERVVDGAVELLRPLEEQPVILSSTTPTDLAKYARCPRRYFLDRLAGLQNWVEFEGEEFAGPDEEAEKGRVRAADLGTAVHQILAGIEPDEDFAKARQLAENFERSEFAARVRAAKWVEREMDLVFAIDELVIQGQIDLCFEEADGTIVIVDYKTDRVRPDEVVERERAYGMQLSLYREGLKKLYPGQPVRSYLVFLRENVVVQSEADLDRALMRRFQLGTDYPVQPGAYCGRCPHVGRACPVKL